MTAQTTNPLDMLRIVESVCNDFDGNGIFSIGAAAALRAMAHHWKDHLAEGHSPAIMAEDIDEMVRQLEVMHAEIMRRLSEPQNASTLYAVFSPSESEINDGAGFWNTRDGWVKISQATRFTHSERQTRPLPIATGQDAIWMLWGEVWGSF